jgi:hypothetical protein
MTTTTRDLAVSLHTGIADRNQPIPRRVIDPLISTFPEGAANG